MTESVRLNEVRESNAHAKKAGFSARLETIIFVGSNVKNIDEFLNGSGALM